MIIKSQVATYIFCMVLVISLLCGQSYQAHAQRIKELFGKEMPTYTRIPDQEFIENSFLQNEMPFGDKSLAYKIRLPKDWSAPDDRVLSNYNLSAHLLGDIAVYYSPPRLESLRSKFQLQALKLEFEVTAEQWLLQYVLSNGFTLEGLKFHNRDKVEALHVDLREGETFVTRTIAQINGKRMILAQYIIPAQSWQNEAPIVAQSLETFELISPEDAVIENLNDHMFLDIAKFSYPESWGIVTKPVRSVDRMEAMINNVRAGDAQILDGQITVNLTSAFVMKSLEDEIEDLKLVFRKKGLVIGDMIETQEDLDFHKQIEFGFIDVYDGNDTQNKSLKYEVWIGVVAMDNYYGFISMLTPSRDEDFFTWSRNTTSYYTILKNLTLQDRAFSLEQ